MTFSDIIRYDRVFHQVTHKGEDSEMSYTKIFENVQDLSISVGNNYSEDQLMHTFFDNFHQCGKYYSQITSHQVELSREGNFTDQKSLYI